MTPEEYRASLRKIRDQYGKNIGIEWRTHHLQPKWGLESELVGWNLTWAGVFSSDPQFLRLKENWIEGQSGFTRSFFSFHFGPYEEQWDLEKVKAVKVIARIDAEDYGGRGFHIHDGDKQRRIFQSELKAPQLKDVTPLSFIESVQQLRAGRDVITAFGLEFA
jgi:hypothetical protein